jgi:hypothetical protein
VVRTSDGGRRGERKGPIATQRDGMRRCTTHLDGKKCSSLCSCVAAVISARLSNKTPLPRAGPRSKQSGHRRQDRAPHANVAHTGGTRVAMGPSPVVPKFSAARARARSSETQGDGAGRSTK